MKLSFHSLDKVLKAALHHYQAHVCQLEGDHRPGLECLSDPQILPILCAMDPDTLLNCGRATRRLHRLVSDLEVWRSLLKGIGSFTKERLEELVRFGLVREEQGLEMKAEVLKEIASRFKLFPGNSRLFCVCGVEAWANSYKVAVSIQGWGSPSTFEMGGRGHLEELNKVAKAVGSKFTVKEVTTYAVLRLGCLWMHLADTDTLDLISGLVDQQGEKGLDKLDLLSVDVLLSQTQGRHSFFSLLKSSKDWKIQTLTLSPLFQEDWTALGNSAPAGHIGTLKLTIYKGSEEKVCKEDVKKVWEIVEKLEVKVYDEDWEDTPFGLLRPTHVLIGGGRGEEPKTSWEEAYENLLNIIC